MGGGESPCPFLPENFVKVFFDLDPAVYMSAFASQHKEYTIVYLDSEGKRQQAGFKDGNEKNAWKRDNAEFIEILDEEPMLIVEEESHARQCAKTLLTRAITRLKRKYGPIDVEYFLTGKGNFREKVATIAKYKGNRDKMEKPVHYQAVRDYFISDWGAVVVKGIEADDEVSIRAWETFRNSDDDYLVATIDKDLDQIPGLHYDYKKHVFYEVDALDGELFFYAQILAGDATDNIKGCYRLGLVKARKLVDEWFDEAHKLCLEPQTQWRRYMWDRIVETYDVNMKQYPEKHEHDLQPEAAAHENAILVYMQQRRDEVWEPPHA